MEVFMNYIKQIISLAAVSLTLAFAFHNDAQATTLLGTEPVPCELTFTVGDTDVDEELDLNVFFQHQSCLNQFKINIIDNGDPIDDESYSLEVERVDGGYVVSLAESENESEPMEYYVSHHKINAVKELLADAIGKKSLRR